MPESPGAADPIVWPVKTREIRNNHMDSRVWNNFVYRDDDIIIATYAKSGTTWVQQIVSQLLFNAETGLPVADMSPWLDLIVPPSEILLPAVESQTHRRFLKTHLPVDAFVYSAKAKYIYIARDGRDVAWSLHNHYVNANDKLYDALNNSPARVGPTLDRPPDSVVDYFKQWMEGDGYPLWSFWENIRTWWEIRDLPNLKLIHFQALKDDMAGEISDIASFLDIPIDESVWSDILDHCSFDYMKANATPAVPLGGDFWDEGAGVFINKGINGRWRDMLSPEESAAYEARAQKELGADCAHWLKTGEMS